MSDLKSASTDPRPPRCAGETVLLGQESYSLLLDRMGKILALDHAAMAAEASRSLLGRNFLLQVRSFPCPRPDIAASLDTLVRDVLSGVRHEFSFEHVCGRSPGRPCFRITGRRLEGPLGPEILLVHENISRIKNEERDLGLAQFTLDQAADAIFWAGESGRFEYVNEQACALVGCPREELLRLSVWDVDTSVTPVLWKTAWEKCRAAGVLRLESSTRTREGKLIPVEVTVKFLASAGKEFHCAYVRDITSRRLLEAQFRQAQKLEAVGRLAGGVAHDFNNLLTVINGYSELLLDRAGLGESDRALLQGIIDAGSSAAGLTRQLLAFSRKQMVQPAVVDLNRLVRQMMSMLKRLLGEGIAIEFAAPEDLGRIKADPGQVEQIVMNLAVNSRDAMPGGGKLRLETANLDVEEEQIPGLCPLPAGSWVALRVRDTGAGMDEAVQARLFEPFFTTKEAGKGTGLGLSTVYGIVKQAGGHITCHSEVGKGTLFTLLFPRCSESSQAPPAPKAGLPVLGRETILVVEDDANVRMLARLGLVGRGYTVLEAASGPEALRLAQDRSFRFDLIVADMFMPGMTGLELTRLLRLQAPALPAILMTGYLDPGVTESDLKKEDIGFLQKPFQSRQLVEMIRAALNRRPAPGSIDRAA